jgi:hypothetical protein
MNRAGGSDRLGRDGLSHPGDRHLPGGAKADATEARMPTDSAVRPNQLAIPLWRGPTAVAFQVLRRHCPEPARHSRR